VSQGIEDFLQHAPSPRIGGDIGFPGGAIASTSFHEAMLLPEMMKKGGGVDTDNHGLARTVTEASTKWRKRFSE